jgi:hypothetical protein
MFPNLLMSVGNQMVFLGSMISPLVMMKHINSLVGSQPKTKPFKSNLDYSYTQAYCPAGDARKNETVVFVAKIVAKNKTSTAIINHVVGADSGVKPLPPETVSPIKNNNVVNLFKKKVPDHE